MMSSEVIVALCAVAGVLAGEIGTAIGVIHRIRRLEEKVDKHNRLVERMAKLEADDADQWRHIEALERG